MYSNDSESQSNIKLPPHDLDPRPAEARNGVEGQGGPLRAELVGVHDEQAGRRRARSATNLDRRLDKAVAQEEILDAVEGRLRVGGAP